MSKTARTLHVGVVAWKRVLETRETLESFCRCNAGQPFQLWYGLDHAYSRTVRRLLDERGAWPAVACRCRRGIAGVHEDMIAAIAEHCRPGDLVLVLENDWRSVRALPWRLLGSVFDNDEADVVRLFGRYREVGAGGVPCRPTDMRRRLADGLPSDEQEDWTPQLLHGERVLVGRSHYNHLPCVARAELLVAMTRDATQERDSIGRCSDHRVVWLADRPCFYHIGGGRRSTKFHGGYLGTRKPAMARGGADA